MTNILAIHAMTLISLNVVVNFTTEVETHLISNLLAFNCHFLQDKNIILMTKYIKWTPLIDYNKT